MRIWSGFKKAWESPRVARFTTAPTMTSAFAFCGFSPQTGSLFQLLAPRSRHGRNFHLGIKSNLEVADHHLIPALVAPADFFRWIGIEFVIRRIVEPRRYFKARTFRQELGLVQDEFQLPVEAVLRHAQQNFFFAGRIDRAELHPLASQMHVRLERNQFGIVLEGSRSLHVIIVGSRWNCK